MMFLCTYSTVVLFALSRAHRILSYHEIKIPWHHTSPLFTLLWAAVPSLSLLIKALRLLVRKQKKPPQLHSPLAKVWSFSIYQLFPKGYHYSWILTFRLSYTEVIRKNIHIGAYWEMRWMGSCLRRVKTSPSPPQIIKHLWGNIFISIFSIFYLFF